MLRRGWRLTWLVAAALAFPTAGCPWLLVGPLLQGGSGGGSFQPQVASVTVTPGTATVLTRTTLQLTATTKDAGGLTIVGLKVTWTSSNTQVATADSTGLVTGGAPGAATITATSEGKSGTAAVTSIALVFAAVSAGNAHTCGVTTGGAAYCWGANSQGVLGDGTATGPQQCGGVGGQSFPCRPTPAAVLGGLTFASVGAGGVHTCGRTPVGAAYCWGGNVDGSLGDGTTTERPSPVPVSGGLSFASLSVGSEHTCAVTTSGAAYCWGNNGSDQLGDGGTEAFSTTPVAVAGGLTFAVVSAGGGHTCGVTSAGAAYCWGDNSAGELGDGTTNGRAIPGAVLGGLSFSAVSAGSGYTCGVTTGGAGYCWGLNTLGQLGDGTTTNRTNPVLVSGGLTFAAVSAARTGGTQSCGVTTGGAAYCWGGNVFGQLGDGTRTNRTSPVLVSGGLTFASVGAGSTHTCGVTTGSAGYCWGANGWAQLGDTTTTDRTVPVKVAGQP